MLSQPCAQQHSRPRSGQLCEIPPHTAGQPGLCERAECQNGAPCVERGTRALCQCLPGFGGPKCEKLLSVNFVDRDTYLQFTDLQDWPRANITLQVRAGRVVRASGGGIGVTAPGMWAPTSPPARSPRLKAMASCCTMVTMTTWLWSCTRATSGSAMTLAPTPARPSTGT